MRSDPTDVDAGPPADATAPPVRRRDRHGRADRGPRLAVPPGVRDPRPGRGERFDRIVLAVVGEVDAPWRDALGELEYAVEDLPILPDDWDRPVPLGALVQPRDDHPRRIVLFRRPLERRAETRTDVELLVRHVVAELLAELLGRAPEEIDPGYDPDL